MRAIYVPEDLLDEVTRVRRPTPQRLRLLRVIARIGPTEDLLAYARLVILADDPDAEIRMAVADILFCKRGGPDP